ncbi:MAG: hypothetical protein RL291_1651 [Pseudomonadota bacterium]
MQIYYPDVPDLPLPPGHRFPASKYRQLKDRLSEPGRLGRAQLLPSPLATRNELLRAHSPAYVDAMLEGTPTPTMMREIGLPWSETLIRRSRATVGGTLAAARSALRDGFSGQLAGGTHHAHQDFGSGFCVFNDFAVTARKLLDDGTVRRIAIVDLDVHQGDGNSAILGQDLRVHILSMHGAKNFPFKRVPSTRDIELADGTDDTTYLNHLANALDEVVRFAPDLVLYLSGADPLAADRLGRLSLTHDGLKARDAHVFQTCHDHRIPVALAIGGGYAEPIELTVDGYAGTFDAARTVYGF